MPVGAVPVGTVPGEAGPVNLEPVAALLRTFARTGRETGASLAVVRDGTVVLDVQVGWADVGRTRPFAADTLVNVYSVSKPVMALATLMALRDRDISLDEPVQRRWPEYAVADKAATTVRHLIAHQAGLPAWPADTAAGLLDRQALTEALVRASPQWPPGAGHGEHALTYGHLLDGYLRQATGVRLAEWLSRFAARVGIADLHLAVPPEAGSRVAELEVGEPNWVASVVGTEDSLWRRSLIHPAGALEPRVLNTRQWREAEFGAIGLHTTARSLARLYGDLLDASGAVARAIGADHFRELLTPSITGIDEVFGLPASWGVGMPVEVGVDGQLEWFGMGGVGGSLAYGNAAAGYAFGFVTRRLAEDDRAEELARALDHALAAAG